MKIGVFDSGKGGEAVARKLKQLIPDAEIISVNDSLNIPYGGRSQQEIITLTSKAIAPLIEAHCDTIVIACNTATVNAIQALRKTYPRQLFVGLEPMIKPATQHTKTGTIAALATPATLQSDRYGALKKSWTKKCTVIEPDCSTWAAHIENNTKEMIPLAETIAPITEVGVDVIVLACTHYHWLEKDIKKLVGNSVTILEPTDAIKNRIFEITGQQAAQQPQ